MSVGGFVPAPLTRERFVHGARLMGYMRSLRTRWTHVRINSVLGLAPAMRVQPEALLIAMGPEWLNERSWAREVERAGERV